MRHWFPVCLLALGVLALSPARAAEFDFIYADEITIRAPLSDWGITLAGLDFGLIVNTGTSDMTATDLDAALFRVDGVPVLPDATFPTINPWLRPDFSYLYYFGPNFTPIKPNEAVGSVIAANTLLTALVAPGETLRNSSPWQFVYYEIYGHDNSPGLVTFNVHLTMGGFRADFPMHVTLVDSPEFSTEFTHATRVSGIAGPSPAKPTTWGKLKRLYR